MKDRIIYLTTDPSGSDNVGAYTLAGTDGTPISATGSSLNVNLTNTAVNLNGSYLEDAAAASGDYLLAAGVQRHDANTSTVSADGDYSLMHVNALGGLKSSLMSVLGNDLVINADGSINANVDVSVVSGSDKVEDVAAANADVLTAIALVRQDVLSSSVSADGDYGWAKMDVKGAMWVNETPNGTYTAAAVSTTTTEAAVSSLAARRKLFIQNLSTSQDVFLVNTGGAAASGFKISRGSTWEFDMGPAIVPYLLTGAGTADTRLLQIAA